MKLQKELDSAKRLACEAGKILLEKRGNLDVMIKGVENYVTNADFAVSEFLRNNLKKEFPEYGVLDEESEIDERDKKYCWIIDPLDGTWGYVKGYSEFAVLIGLIENGKSILGVIYRPLKNELIWGVKGEGAYLQKLNVEGLILDEFVKKIKIRKDFGRDVLVSMERENPFFDYLNQEGYKPVKMPTSHKINAVARGDYSSFLCDWNIIMGIWDFCAHQVILEEAGGILVNALGEEIDYLGKRENKFGIIVTHPSRVGEFVELMKRRKINSIEDEI